MPLIFDGEYSGLDTKKGHGIISLAAIHIECPSDMFHVECRLDSNQTYDTQSLAINGATVDEIYSLNRTSLDLALHSFQSWITTHFGTQKPCLVSQNMHKDLEHLENGFERVGLEYPLSYRNMDLHSMAAAVLINDGASLPTSHNLESELSMSYLSNFVGIPPEPKPHSTALTGVKQTAEIYSRLFLDEPLLDDFKDY